MKYILSLISCFLVLISCTKESEFEAPEGITYAPKKNAYRAVKISGTNTHWGNFTLHIGYDKEEMNSLIRTNAQGDTVGGFGLMRSSGYLTYFIQDYVPMIDKDSIQRLDAKLTDKYGTGNYDLWDSIPKSAESIVEATIYLYTDGRIKKSNIKNYKPNEKNEAVGEEFAYSYILETTTASTYEYNANSNICVNRIMSDQHNPVDKELYERSLYKTEIGYDGNKITSLIWFTAPSGENFIENNRYDYTYSGNQVTAINGEGFTRKFTYNGKQVTMTTNNSETTTYELDSHGNVVKMNDGKGNVYQIEYESGNGNFSIFTFMSDQMTNPFFIK